MTTVNHHLNEGMNGIAAAKAKLEDKTPLQPKFLNPSQQAEYDKRIDRRIAIYTAAVQGYLSGKSSNDVTGASERMDTAHRYGMIAIRLAREEGILPKETT